MNNKRVLIVGGGIGGLTLANALQRHDIDFEIAEKSPEFQPIGAGISLALNAVSVLDQLRLKPHIDEVALRLPTASVCDHAARTIREIDFPELTGAPDAGIWTMRRSDLQSALLRPIHPTRFRMGTVVQKLDWQGDRAVVRFHDGQSHDYDLVVGADGVNSSIRTLIFPKWKQPRRLGVVYWLFLAPNFPHDGRFRESMGRGRRVGIAPLTNGDAFVFLTRNARPPFLWGGDQGAVKRDFAEFEGMCGEAISRAGQSSPLVAREFTEVRLRSWSRGRFVLMGDAAHAMTPNMGQGAAMAIEDAWVLADCLHRFQTDHAIRRYQQLRLRRVAWVQSQSARIGRVMQSESVVARTLRDAAVRWTPDWLHGQQFKRAHLGGPVRGIRQSSQRTTPQRKRLVANANASS